MYTYNLACHFAITFELNRRWVVLAPGRRNSQLQFTRVEVSARGVAATNCYLALLYVLLEFQY